MMQGTRTSLFWTTMLMIGALATGCGEGSFEADGAGEEEVMEVTSDLTSSQRRERSRIIQSASVQAGLNNAVLLAGIANAETGMAHCWSEATWACKGPASASCGGGPVIAGSGDGPCSRKQGGLGYFQFDAGTHNQTIAQYGADVVTIEGNTRNAVDFVVNMVIRSRYIDNVSNRAQALDWLETVRPNGRNWSTWIKTVTHYYNGCVPGRCGVYNARITSYTNKSLAIYNEFGQDFWYGDIPEPTPIELSTPADLEPAMASVELRSSIPLTWTSVDDAFTYDVAMEYGTDGETWRQYHTWTNRQDNTFRVWPQISDNYYRWRVRACRSGQCSEWSDFAMFAYGSVDPIEEPEQPEQPVEPEEPEQPVEPEQPEEPVEPEEPEEPRGLRAPGAMSPAGGTFRTSSVELTWEDIDEAIHYDVSMEYRTGSTWRSYHTWTKRTGSTFTVWPQVNRADYRWRVRACDASKCSDYTEFEQFHYSR